MVSLLNIVGLCSLVFLGRLSLYFWCVSLVSFGRFGYIDVEIGLPPTIGNADSQVISEKTLGLPRLSRRQCQRLAGAGTGMPFDRRMAIG